MRYLSPPVQTGVTAVLLGMLICALSLGAFLVLHQSPPDRQLSAAALGPILFEEHFQHGLELYNEYDHSGRWRTQYVNGGLDSRASRTHGELQCYVDPGFAHLGLNPFHIHQDAGEGAVLAIALRPASLTAQRACFGSAFTSGMISSQPVFAMTDGYWEVRARMPKPAPGVWPAIWLLPADGEWPPEIDIDEMAQGVLFCTLHSLVDRQHVADGRGFPELGNLSDRFHSFGLLKTSTSLTWFLDGQAIRTVSSSPQLNQPFYLIINLAMGDNSWTGHPTHASTPSDLEVASIRAYALK